MLKTTLIELVKLLKLHKYFIAKAIFFKKWLFFSEGMKTKIIWSADFMVSIWVSCRAIDPKYFSLLRHTLIFTFVIVCVLD